MEFIKFVNEIVIPGKDRLPVSIYTDKHDFYLDIRGDEVFYFVDNTDRIAFHKSGDFSMWDVAKAIGEFEYSL